MIRSQYIYFGVTPPLHSLCCITVSSSGANKLGKSTHSNRSHVIKCREIIFTEPKVVAAPSEHGPPIIHVIMPMDYYKEGSLTARLLKLGMKVMDPESVTLPQYEACFRYTLTAKMAPNWNTVDNFLVYGRDFLTSRTKQDGIQFDMQFTLSQYTISINPLTVTLPQLELSDLDISPGLINQFNSKALLCINESSIGSKWCNILPSNKKGQIVKVLHKLPTGNGAGFSSYRDLKRYWKNTYGYRLPDTDDNILYLQVYFKMIGQKLFTYPSVCVRRDGFVSQSGRNCDMATLFISDLKKLLRSVCGFSVKLSAMSWKPELNLTAAAEINSPSTKRDNYNATPAVLMKGRQCRPPHETPSASSSSTVTLSAAAVTNQERSISSEMTITPIDSASHSSQPYKNGAGLGEYSKPMLPPFMLKSAQRKILKLSNTTTQTSCANKLKQNISGKLHVHRSLPAQLAATSSITKSTASLPTTSTSAISSGFSDHPSKFANISLTAPIKRPHQDSTSTSETNSCDDQVKSTVKKKARTKVDVPDLASKSMLSKATTRDLTDWLLSKGVTFSSKDRKRTLIETVNRFLHIEP